MKAKMKVLYQESVEWGCCFDSVEVTLSYWTAIPTGSHMLLSTLSRASGAITETHKPLFGNHSDAIRLAAWTFDRAVFDHPSTPAGIAAKAADWVINKPGEHYHLELARS